MNEIKYEELIQESLINVIKNILKKVAKDGMPSKHHFYISFRTDYPGAVIPEYMRESHPEEIMIVLQYQFWNLQVLENKFSVKLSFGGVQEKIEVPFSAITAFVDPSVKFGLKFDTNFNSQDEDYNERLEISKSQSETKQAQIISFDTFKKK